jgi:hypothetical protein
MLAPLLQGMTLRHGTIGPCHFEGAYYPHLERSLSPGLKLISPSFFCFLRQIILIVLLSNANYSKSGQNNHLLCFIFSYVFRHRRPSPR